MPAIPGEVARVKDFRTILDRKDIDAVVIATPDHWHAIQMIAACRAGQDVYVEKPLSMTVVEGRAMVDAARKHDRIVQVGTHRRSSRMYAQLAESVRSGALGKVTVARAAFANNMTPAGIGHAPDSAPPAKPAPPKKGAPSGPFAKHAQLLLSVLPKLDTMSFGFTTRGERMLLSGEGQALLVTDDGKPAGIVTRADLLESLVS